MRILPLLPVVALVLGAGGYLPRRPAFPPPIPPIAGKPTVAFAFETHDIRQDNGPARPTMVGRPHGTMTDGVTR